MVSDDVIKTLDYQALTDRGVWGAEPPNTVPKPPKRTKTLRFCAFWGPGVAGMRIPATNPVPGGPFMGPELGETHLNPTSERDPNPKRWPF